MSEELERSIREKIVELQIYLGSRNVAQADLEAIERHLGKAVDVFLNPEARSSACGTS